MSDSTERIGRVVELLEDGKVLVTASIREVIPTAKYANVELFASSTQLVDDPVGGINEAFEYVEKGREQKRDEIIDMLESGN